MQHTIKGERGREGERKTTAAALTELLDLFQTTMQQTIITQGREGGEGSECRIVDMEIPSWAGQLNECSSSCEFYVILAVYYYFVSTCPERGRAKGVSMSTASILRVTLDSHSPFLPPRSFCFRSKFCLLSVHWEWVSVYILLLLVCVCVPSCWQNWMWSILLMLCFRHCSNQTLRFIRFLSLPLFAFIYSSSALPTVYFMCVCATCLSNQSRGPPNWQCFVLIFYVFNHKHVSQCASPEKWVWALFVRLPPSLHWSKILSTNIVGVIL